MSSTKRRKLNASSASPLLSAFAARQALTSHASRPSKASKGLDGNDSIEDVPTESKFSESRLSDAGFDAQKEVANMGITIEESGTEETFMNVVEDAQLSSAESRAETPEIPIERLSITLSSFKPTKDTIKELGDGTLYIRLAPGERLVVLGQFEISIQKGQITIMGSTLQPSEQSYRVFASCSHSLPVMRCLTTDVEHAEVLLHRCEAGLGLLESLSPLFGKLWNDSSGPLGTEYARLIRTTEKSTFQILFPSSDSPAKAYLQPLISPPEWNEMLERSTISTDQGPRSLVICGPKSSGKSTFAKLLANRLLSIWTDSSKSTKSNQKAGVALLDLDPGQPEYSPPGELSLVHILEPNFGPPFTHPIPGGKSKIIRSHSIAATSPSLDPSLYMACVADLYAHYRNLLSTCPLVINTPGWVLGTGLEILMEIIIKVQPSGIIYMSQDGPTEVVQSLRDIAESPLVVGLHPTDPIYTSPNRPRKVIESLRAARSVPVLTLPSQVSDYTTRTAAHLRTMQSMSYFHLDTTKEDGLTWSGLPLTSVPPWELRYSGGNPGMLGVLCYGEQPPATLLADTVNGSLVAVVVIDDLAAIPGWTPEGEEAANLPCQISKVTMETNDTEIRAFDQNSLQPQCLEKPLIIRTPNEEIPYFNPANTISLDPRYSHSIGLALVRGIDVARRRLQVLTPIPPRVIEEINEARKSIVLISGKLDTPGWAYIEELTQKITLDKATRKTGSAAEGTDSKVFSGNNADEGMGGTEDRSLGDGFQNAPWIDKLEGSQGRGIGARVWRVRRDLGRTGDGGD